MMVATQQLQPETGGSQAPQRPPVQHAGSRRMRKRAARRERFLASEPQALPAALRRADPLARGSAPRAQRALAVAALLAGSFALHAVPVLVAGGVQTWLPSWQPEARRGSERLRVAVIEAPAKQPQRRTEPASTVRDEPARPERPAAPVSAPRARAGAPPADPVDVPPPPAAEPVTAAPPRQPRRRVVGLSFESTVVGGRGPALAVGNTRMGRTASTASSPESVEKLQPHAAPRNRGATRLDAPGVAVVAPRRLSQAPPPYPEELRRQGLEADVVVVVEVDERGRVVDVDVVKPAEQPAFNDAARRAASGERFAPATRDAQPVPYSLRYTYRFRLNET